MFKKQQTIEEDFIQYHSDDVIGEQPKKETSFLSTIIRLLTALILLGVLIIGGIFGYRFLQNETVAKVIDKAPVVAPTKTPTLAVQAPKEQRMYTQDEMQDIVQMMMKKMQEEQKDETTKTAQPSTDERVEAEASLITSLENIEVDHMEELKIENSIGKQESNKEITNESSGTPVDNYNKVIVNTGSNTYADVDELSLKIGDIVKEMKNKSSTKNSVYTQQITQEVQTRENAMRIIIVRSGDTLSKISKRAYGSAMEYDRILNANPDLIKNPNHIYVGQRLRIPTNEYL